MRYNNSYTTRLSTVVEKKTLLYIFHCLRLIVLTIWVSSCSISSYSSKNCLRTGFGTTLGRIAPKFMASPPKMDPWWVVDIAAWLTTVRTPRASALGIGSLERGDFLDMVGREKWSGCGVSNFWPASTQHWSEEMHQRTLWLIRLLRPVVAAARVPPSPLQQCSKTGCHVWISRKCQHALSKTLHPLGLRVVWQLRQLAIINSYSIVLVVHQGYTQMQ